MIKRQHRFVKHENGVVHGKIINAGLRNIFDSTNHVVAEVTNSTSGERRQVRQLYGFEARHGCAQIFHETRRLAVTAALDKKWISSQERVARDSLAAFNTLEQESVRAVSFQLQKRRHRRQEI